MGLIYACANKFKGRGIEFDDLVQAGCLGFVKALDNFDENRGVKLTTYAVPVILGEIKRIFRDGGSVKISRSIKELSLKIIKAKNEYIIKNGIEPKVSTLAEILNIEPEKITEALCASRQPLSLTVEDEDSENQFDIPIDSHEEKLVEIMTLKKHLQELDEKDRELIKLRYFKNKTQVETAKVLNMTQVQISRREKKILKILKDKLLL